jgi:DNA ligase-associated metallophosphoesterase
MDIELAGEKVKLWPQKAVYFPARKILLVADLHFGKINHFRKAGIPLPTKANNKNAELLIQLLHQTNPTRLIFLGDLFHSHYNEEWEVIGQIRKHFSYIRFELVVGNHDIMSAHQYHKHQIELNAQALTEGPFVLTHEPMEAVPPNCYNLSGHLHPGVRLRGQGRQSMLLPCFWFGRHQAILPAFGSFTGLARIHPKREDKIYIIADDKIIPYAEN